MTKYLITGATSLVGLGLCDYISSIDNNFIYLVCRKDSAGLRRIAPKENIYVYFADLEHLNEILEQIEEADVFINLAWTDTDHNGRDNPQSQNRNVDLAINAMHIAAKLKCRLFVDAGSQAEYGYIPGLITEDTVCKPDTEYGKAKLQVFEKGSKICSVLGIKYLHLRLFSTFGANDRPWTLIISAIQKMLANEEIKLSTGTQNWNYLYVADCAKQIYLLCNYLSNRNDFKFGIYHIASKDTRHLKEFVEEMQIVIGSKSKLIYGGISQTRNVSLNPSVRKTEEAIGFINETSFGDAIRKIVEKNYKIKL